ncbi:MAG: tRNA (guanosine(37)-N1)-methyltransferase TrmD [Clostridiaceae bacterium]|nr:tRNA (guanosine(37)-N1)-methyltransferase TrmD [Clostridiaceae bacterium]
MKFSVLSLFPDQVLEALRFSMTRRAMENALIDLEAINIRDFAINEYGQVDDAPYGGGRGMVMMCEPVYQAWLHAKAESDGADQAVRTIFLTPAGQVFDQALAQSLAKEPHVILICGHYEGIDCRVIDEIEAEEVSIGDFILTGGELAAAVMIDAISRLVPGVLPDQEAWELESFSDGLLEWPQYTRPSLWRGHEVPPVLLSGHEARIARERQLMQALETLRKKPSLLLDRRLDPSIWELLAEAMQREEKEAQS